jgi:CHAD domain-containing protein
MPSPQQKIQALTKDLSKSASRLKDEVSPKNVHRLRTTVRRIESLVNHFYPQLGKKQEKTLVELTALRKRAGKVRDLDVQAGLLSAIANGSSASDRLALKQALATRRARRAERLVSVVKKLDLAKDSERLRRLAQKSRATAQAGLPEPLEQAKAELTSLAETFSPSEHLKPKRLHEVRIKIKKIRYLAETGANSTEQQRFLQQLKYVQDATGEWHDWELLTRTAEKQFGNRINCPLLVEIRSLFSARYSAAASAVGRLFAAQTGDAPRKQPRSASAASTAGRRAG